MKRFVTMLLALAMCFSITVPASAQSAAESSNINAQEYVNMRWWAVPMKSHLYENGSGGLTRVEYISDSGGKIVVEDYDSSFLLQSSRTIEPELPVWGGFFAGEDYNFLVFGQDNKEKDDNQEVVRVVKYDKDWKRMGQASLKGANTTEPFYGGSLRCTEYNGYLYIRTCHVMYNGHQANMMLNIRQSDMVIADSFYTVMPTDEGYVSHSFNQFVLVDSQNRIVTLDHGDAYPRSIVLMRYYAPAGQDSFQKEIRVQVGAGLGIGFYTVKTVEKAGLVVFPGGGSETTIPDAPWAVNRGVTTGRTATTFDPNGICNRGQIVTFLFRAMQKQ